MNKIETEIVVIGSGPGGYAAAFYAADHGKKVILVEKDEQLGGVCLNRGCIPSKALLHASHVFNIPKEAKGMGIVFSKPKINLDALRSWKAGIIEKLSSGVKGLAQKKGVQVILGRGYFENSELLRVETSEGQKFISFQKAILAVGSRPALPPAFDLGNKRIMTSTEALELEEIPEKMLVVGGGYIGMELGTVYASLGSKVVLVEVGDSLLMGADADLVRPVLRHAEEMYSEIRLKTKITKMATSGKQIKVVMESESGKVEELYDRVLVAAGRRPNKENLGLENTKVECDEKGFVKVNVFQQTNDASIYAIGDIAGGILLAHKASKEARIAVNDILGVTNQESDKLLIPAVVFTEPEIAWVGLTESEAKQKGQIVKVSKFPWGAAGKALAMNAGTGVTKLIVDPETERVLGVGIVGKGAGDLISEGTLAIEMGATVYDLAHTIHPHPTLSETLMEAAEVFYGHSAHMHTPKQK